MGIPDVEAACRYADFPEPVKDDIWEPELKPGFHVTKEVKRIK